MAHRRYRQCRANASPNAEIDTVAGDLTDTDALRNTAERADAAIHLAQDYSPSTATADLGAATAIQHGLGSRPYVHTGGAWVYGNTIGVVDETAPQSPPPITSWRPDNERRVLARAADGGSGASSRG